jgi:ubiquitin carboxyl-terminal hydrolase 4/11/15
LSFLVDALHEDLNRILKKPYNENPDSDDNTIHDPQAIIELGEIYQKNHKARNDSVAMDLFSGFYKNTMECPVCDKISITFDPYSLLTVQLPIEHTFQHTVTFVPLRSSPLNHMIDIDKNSTIKTLKEYIASKHPGVQADRLWMIECYNHKIYKVFDNAQTLAEANVQTNDYLFVFELEDVPSNPPQPEKKSYYSFSTFGSNRDDKVPEMDDPKADQFAVPVFSRQKNRTGNGFDITLHPMYITITREEAKDYEIILKKVLIAASRLTSTPILSGEADTSSNEVSPTDEMEKDDQVPDPGAQVNDTSSSEDGYVNVSVNKPQPNGDSGPEIDGVDTCDDRPIPSRFMDADYFITPTLRNQLFALNYAQGDNNMYCASMSSISDRTVRNMFDRVKLPSRRNSVDSSSSGEESTTSTRSGAQANGQSDESESEMDKPDLTLGGEMSESYLGLPTPIGDDDNGSPGDSAFDPTMSRKGRRKNNKHGKKGRRGKMKTYSRKDRKGQQQGGFTPINQNQRFGGKANFEEDDNPYYIKLGEGIVLDWYPEAFDALFGGSTTDANEMRGQFVSHSDGKGLPYFDDPTVKEKRELREARKRNGITLDDCFVETGKREVLSEDNAWYCNRCKELRRATKTLEIWTIPDILVVHLKRFGGTRSFRDKIDVLVDYAIEGLDMTERIGLKENGKEYVYDLFAVDNHYGGLGGGHYTALAKNFNDGQWYDYNGKRADIVFGKDSN